ncbi:hypothetical protein EJ02DRAFT_79192 [Clathrospora elynae]|uniref:Uncharacterized protein n=1 Tax=Clathrospora elynae TaxID=706981 RepID=A0A6A5SZK3_9PLEO|nr:hypothetical protein EJ02DRAFT_79192 [Clathrospora elynae]
MEAGVLLLRGRMLFIHYCHLDPLYPTHRLISVSQPWNVTKPKASRPPSSGQPSRRTSTYRPPLHKFDVSQQTSSTAAPALIFQSSSKPRRAASGISQTYSTAFETRSASRVYWLARPVTKRPPRCTQTIGLHLKLPIPGVLHLNTRNIQSSRIVHTAAYQSLARRAT